MVRGDGPAIGRALANLLANAVRLAPQGTTIIIGLASSDEGVELSVADEGPGIDVADQHAIFTRFWRGDDEGAGSGLGLSIVRRVAERHGGSASVQSVVGRGSTFTVKLPSA